MPDCIFCKIADRQIGATPVYEDDECIAFHDLNPQAPVHVLVIPKEHTGKIGDYSDADEHIVAHVLLVACKVAKQLGVGEGFRLVTNNGASAGQSVFHWHVHLLGGRAMGWPPG